MRSPNPLAGMFFFPFCRVLVYATTQPKNVYDYNLRKSDETGIVSFFIRISWIFTKPFSWPVLLLDLEKLLLLPDSIENLLYVLCVESTYVVHNLAVRFDDVRTELFRQAFRSISNLPGLGNPLTNLALNMMQHSRQNRKLRFRHQFTTFLTPRRYLHRVWCGKYWFAKQPGPSPRPVHKKRNR